MDLKRAALVGVGWSALSETFVAGLQVVQLAVLARLLVPSDFGLFAIIVAVMGVVAIFSDAGLNDAIVQRQAPTDAQLSSLYWLNVGVGLALCALVMIIAKPVAAAMGDARIAGLLALTAVQLGLRPFGHQYGLLLQKYLDFRALSSVEMLVAVVSAVAAIGTALAGAGVYALVWGQLAGTVISVAALNALGRKLWRPALHFARADLRGYLGFGFYALSQRVVETVANQIDKLLVGALVGTNALGAYYLALQISELPLHRFNAIGMRVLLPIFARRQDQSDALRYGYLVTVRGMATLGLPMSLGIAVTAPWLVPVLLGDGWQNAVLLLQVLAIGNLFVYVNIPGHALVLARGKARLKFLWSILFSAMRIPLVLAGIAAAGVVGLVLALAAFRAIAVVPFYRLMVRSQLGPCARQILAEIAPPAVLSVVMAGSVLAFMAIWNDATLAGLAAAVALGVAIYAVLLMIFQLRHVREVRRLVLGSRNAG